MTTPLKASRFNIRRPDPGTAPAAAPRPAPSVVATAAKAAPTRATPLDDTPFDSHDDGFGDQVFPGSAKADALTAPAPASAETDAQLDAIRKEGLTGRQLRVARRLAQRHNLPATSDYDAVRLLRAAGVDEETEDEGAEAPAETLAKPAPRMPRPSKPIKKPSGPGRFKKH